MKISAQPVFCLALLGTLVCQARAQAPSTPESQTPTAEQAAQAPQPAPEKPPTPPRVSCHDDQLLIVAEDSMVSSILSAIHRCTGVEIAIPSGVADSRSYVSLGPGPMREVLNELLMTTDYDYVIQSSITAPKTVAAVLLMARNSGSSDSKDAKGTPVPAGLTMTPARRAWMAARQANRPQGSIDADAEPSRPAETDAPQPVAPDPTPNATSETSTTTPPATVAAAAAPTTDTAVQTSTAASTSAAAANSTPASADQAAQTGAADKTDKSTTDAGGDPSAPAPSADAATATPASTSDTAQTSPSKELQNRITSMQQLFEQRKQMNSTPADQNGPN